MFCRNDQKVGLGVALAFSRSYSKKYSVLAYAVTKISQVACRDCDTRVHSHGDAASHDRYLLHGCVRSNTAEQEPSPATGTSQNESTVSAACCNLPLLALLPPVGAETTTSACFAMRPAAPAAPLERQHLADWASDRRMAPLWGVTARPHPLGWQLLVLSILYLTLLPLLRSQSTCSATRLRPC